MVAPPAADITQESASATGAAPSTRRTSKDASTTAAGGSAAAPCGGWPAGGLHRSASTSQPGSHAGSPGKPLPPKTPAPGLVDTGAAPLPGTLSPASALTQALKQSASLPALGGGGGGGASSSRPPQPWGSAPSIPDLVGRSAATHLPASHARGSAGLAAQAAAVAAAEAAAAADALHDDDMLLFTAPAVGSADDPQLLVHSPESSMDMELDVLCFGGAAAAAPPPPPAAAPTSSPTSSRPTGDSSSSRSQPMSVTVASSAAGSSRVEEAAGYGEEDGGCTPRPPVLHMPGLDFQSPTSDGFSLAELLQGPAPPPPRVPSMAHSPGSRTAFLHDPNLEDSGGGISPRRPLLLGGSPLAAAVSGLRDPPLMSGMPGMPTLHMAARGLPPSLLLPSQLGFRGPSSGGGGGPTSGPAPGLPRPPLSGPLPMPGMQQQAQGAGAMQQMRRPLLQPMGQQLARPPPGAAAGALKQQQPLQQQQRMPLPMPHPSMPPATAAASSSGMLHFRDLHHGSSSGWQQQQLPLPLMRPSGAPLSGPLPLPPHHHAAMSGPMAAGGLALRRPLGGGMPRPAGGQQLQMPTHLMVPVPCPTGPATAAAHATAAGSRGCSADWAPPFDEFLTPDGVRLVTASQSKPTPAAAAGAASLQQDAARQHQQASGPSDSLSGSRLAGPAAAAAAAGVAPVDSAAVAVQPASDIRQPASTAAYAAIKAEAAAGAAAAAAAILAAPSTAMQASAGAAGAAAGAAAARLPFGGQTAGPALQQPLAMLPGTASAPGALGGMQADGRVRRVPGGDPLQSEPFRRFLDMIRGNSGEFEAQGRVLRLRQYLRPDVRPRVLDAVLDALEANTRVEALYIQNFEQGLLDDQLDRLARLLRHRRIWALNVGENYGTSQQAWRRFCDGLPLTSLAYLYVSEQHLMGTDMKTRMRDAIRVNRRVAPVRNPEVIVHVGNMWWNPKLPSGYSPSAATAAAGGTPPAGASRDSLTGGGSGPGDMGSAGRVGGCPPAASAAAAAASHAGGGVLAGMFSAMPPGALPPLPTAGMPAFGATGLAAAAAAAVGQPGYALRLAPKRRQDYPDSDLFSGSPLAKRGPAAAAFAAISVPVPTTVPMAMHYAAAPAQQSLPLPLALPPAAAAAPAAAPAAGAAPLPPAAAATAVVVVARGAGGSRRPSRPSAARLLQNSFSSDDDEEDEEQFAEEEDEEDAAYLPFKSGLLVSADPHAAPTRASQRIQRRSVHAYQGHLPMDDEFISFDPADEPPSPPRAAAARRPRPPPQAAAPAAHQHRPAPRQHASANGLLRNGMMPVSGSSGSGSSGSGSIAPVTGAGAPTRRPLAAAAPPAGGAGPAAATRAIAAGGPRAASAAAKRSLHAATQRIRSTSSRQSLGDLKGKPSFSELVESGFMQPGAYRFTVGMQDIHAALEADGTILYGGARYRAISKFALVVLRERNPSRQSCDGWKEVAWNGEKLDVLRARFQSHMRKAQARKPGALVPPTAA